MYILRTLIYTCVKKSGFGGMLKKGDVNGIRNVTSGYILTDSIEIFLLKKVDKFHLFLCLLGLLL